MSENYTNPLSHSYRYGGVGWPWDNTLKSYFEKKSDHDILSTSIQMIILTMLGERVMLNDFGSNFRKLLFDPSDEFLDSDLTSIVQSVVPRWDPRLEVLSVTSEVIDRDDTKVSVSVVYRDKTNPRSGPTTVSFEVGK